MQTTVYILAGGKSTRMGEDKAVMFNNTNRLVKLAESFDCKTVVCCGDASRINMFDGECIPDPEHVNSLPELISWLLEQNDGPMILLPCDAFEMGEEGFAFLLENHGVPLDSQGMRQPLLASLPQGFSANKGRGSILSMFSELQSLDNPQLAGQWRNFNRPEDLNHS